MIPKFTPNDAINLYGYITLLYCAFIFAPTALILYFADHRFSIRVILSTVLWLVALVLGGIFYGASFYTAILTLPIWFYLCWSLLVVAVVLAKLDSKLSMRVKIAYGVGILTLVALLLLVI